MTGVDTAHAAQVDGLIRNGRTAGMTTAQLVTAGRDLAGRLREAVANNPLVTEYFPAAAEGYSALARSIELAVTELTANVPADLSSRIDAAYASVAGWDAFGQTIPIGPLLRRELVALAGNHEGSNASLDAAIRRHILGSEEAATTKRAVVEDGFARLLGRASTLDERNSLQAWIDGRLDSGATLGQVSTELDQRLRTDGDYGREYALMERAGAAWSQVHYDKAPPDAKTKRQWVTWVQTAMIQRGLTEEQALQYLPMAIEGRL